MKVLLTGADGQLGRAIIGARPPDVHLVECDRAALDVTDAVRVRRVIEEVRPDWIFHCAAYTQVDEAERHPELAFSVNAEGTASVARAAKAVGARVIYVSTDYVFSGDSARPWRPSDAPRPLSQYGKSKLAGEFAVNEILGAHATIVRTSWLYAPWGRNFVRTILDRLRSGRAVEVVDDQRGSPTSALELANALWEFMRRGGRGVSHWTNLGDASWYEFALELSRQAVEVRLLDGHPVVSACSTDPISRPAPRPRYSVLDCEQ